MNYIEDKELPAKQKPKATAGTNPPRLRLTEDEADYAVLETRLGRPLNR